MSTVPAGGTSAFPEGNAIVYCEGAFNTGTGKTAHGLVRRTARYRVVGVIDSRHAGSDAGLVLDGKANGIPIFASLSEALDTVTATHFVMGLAPDGGRLTALNRVHVREAVARGLNVDSGLHDFISDDPEIARLAAEKGVRLRDVRKTPPRSELHSFSGRIAEVGAVRVALLGTDSACGKRTTAWLLVEALRKAGFSAAMVGTGQTAWMQGVESGIILDSLINDFVAGELEHAVLRAWDTSHPDVIVIEGQGSLMNPAYPGGLEILAATRPHAIVLQHAPARREYDGFPGFPLHPLAHQIQALELVSGKRVVAVTVNHEGIAPAELGFACREITRETGLVAVDPLVEGAGAVVEALRPFLPERR